MPPEWVRHERYWMAWPCRAGRWGDHLDAARDVVAEAAKLVAEQGPVTMLANPAEVADVSLSCGPGIAAMVVPHGDCCMRSMAPSFLLDFRGGMIGVRWPDKWGNAVADAILTHLALPRVLGPWQAPGGFFDVDGEGTCLASEGLLTAVGCSRDEAERSLSDYLGVDKVIWLKCGLEGDVTGGHIHNLARFLRPGVVLALTDDERGDVNAELLKENVLRLKAARDAKNREITVARAPQPKRKLRADGSRICASYANCFVNRNLVVLPAFEDAKDQVAYDSVVGALLDHVVISLPALELAYGGSGFADIAVAQPSIRSLT